MYHARFKEYNLNFKFPAGTSRGVLFSKKSWYIIIERNRLFGIGECSIIPGLSPDADKDIASKLKKLCSLINQGNNPLQFDLMEFPSIRFGLETAIADLTSGADRVLFPSDFTDGIKPISINGLIWMGNPDFINKQVREKIESGFSCLKFKIGSADFESELELLRKIRTEYQEIEIRLDANGAFSLSDALEKLEKLSKLRIHSVEQPIKPNHLEQMALICEKSPVPIALDEELIGVNDPEEQRKLLEIIKPAYIIIKPGLLGGIEASEKWITLAGKTKTGWWVTSALESNIGLNVIAQWVSTLHVTVVQGLGTGQLYANNIPSPLEIRNAGLFYSPQKKWDLSNIIQ